MERDVFDLSDSEFRFTHRFPVVFDRFSQHLPQRKHTHTFCNIDPLKRQISIPCLQVKLEESLLTRNLLGLAYLDYVRHAQALREQAGRVRWTLLLRKVH
jgi:hypothetical protein